MTKDEVLAALDREHQKLMVAIDGLSAEAVLEPGVIDNWSVKDILYHISMWESELVKLLWQAENGQKPTTVHFNNPSVDELNASWYEQGKDRPLVRVMEDFQGVRKQTMRRVRAFSDHDLEDEKRFPWLDGKPLWTWIAVDSFDHEAEHTAQILAWRKRQGDQKAKT